MYPDHYSDRPHYNSNHEEYNSNDLLYNMSITQPFQLISPSPISDSNAIQDRLQLLINLPPSSPNSLYIPTHLKKSKQQKQYGSSNIQPTFSYSVYEEKEPCSDIHRSFSAIQSLAAYDLSLDMPRYIAAVPAYPYHLHLEEEENNEPVTFFGTFSNVRNRKLTTLERQQLQQTNVKKAIRDTQQQKGIKHCHVQQMVVVLYTSHCLVCYSACVVGSISYKFISYNYFLQLFVCVLFV